MSYTRQKVETAKSIDKRGKTTKKPKVRPQLKRAISHVYMVPIVPTAAALKRPILNVTPCVHVEGCVHI